MEKYFSDDFIQKTVEKISTEAVSCIMEQIKSAINEKQQRSVRTIEERAKEYSLKDFDGYYTGREKAMEEGYIAGAQEQKQIDRIHFKKWYCKKICYKRNKCQPSSIMCYRLGQIVKEIENI